MVVTRNHDMLYDVIYVVIWYDVINMKWNDLWYDMIRYEMIYVQIIYVFNLKIIPQESKFFNYCNSFFNISL